MAEAGTPLWLTLTLQAATLLATHVLTLARERRKRDEDVLKEWRKDQESLLRECVDAAVAHYVDASALAGTSASASRILDKLRRFRARLTAHPTKDASDAAQAKRLYIELHQFITDESDFQDLSRVIRSPDDPLLDRIRACEDDLLRNLAKKRLLKKS